MIDEDPKLAELGRDLARLVRVDWNPERARRTEQGLVARRRRRTARTWLVATAAIGVLAITTWRFRDPVAKPDATAPIAEVSNRPSVVTPPDATTPANDPVAVRPALQFSDGSTAVPLVDEADLQVVREDAEQIVVALGTGAARFDVAEAPARTFRLTACRDVATRCEDISIDVAHVAAKFAVAREAHRVRIEVYEGLLHVTSPDGVRELATGTTYDIPSNVERTAAKRDVDEPRSTPADANEEPLPTVAPDAAPADANTEPLPTVTPDAAPARDVLDELLLAADHKRREGNFGDAVALLRQILRDHAGDARAPLVAFTLGRVLLQLKRPAEAAEAFATADRLAPHGPMAQDAVARQVEAMALAGNTAGARSVAQAYVARFPAGRRLADVRVWGGL